MSVKKFFDFLSKFHYDSIFDYSSSLSFNLFIDVGSHEGELISRFLRYKKINKFYCFEPNETLFDKLYIKYKNNQKIFLSKKALGENKATKKLFLSNLTYNSSMSSFNKNSLYLKLKNLILDDNKKQKFSKVQQVTFDDFFKDKKIENSFLKIDVEGYEYNVLIGASKKIKDVKYLLIENQFSNQYKNNINEVKDLITKYEFKLIKNFYYPSLHYKDMLFINKRYK